jgi:hypothetical protein
LLPPDLYPPIQILPLESSTTLLAYSLIPADPEFIILYPALPKDVSKTPAAENLATTASTFEPV